MGTSEWGGKRDKIGLAIASVLLIILIIGNVFSYYTSTITGSNTNNQHLTEKTTSSEHYSSSNDSPSRGTITTSEIVTPIELPDVMKQTLGDNIQVTINKTSTGLSVVAFVPPHYDLGLVVLGSNAAFNTFQTIFSDSRFQSVSYVGIVFMDNFVDKYGNKSNGIGLEYGVSRSTAEKVKDWHHYMDYSSNDPVGWFRSIMDPTNDMVYVNPVELKG